MLPRRSAASSAAHSGRHWAVGSNRLASYFACRYNGARGQLQNMNPPKLPHYLFLSLALIVVTCAVASVRLQPAEAAAINGKLAFVNEFSIYTINPDGSGITQLTQHDQGLFDQYPNWSPDGAKIVFGRATFTVKSQIY